MIDGGHYKKEVCNLPHKGGYVLKSKKDDTKRSEPNVADRYYNLEQKRADSFAEEGIAETYEQTMDTVIEGTIDGKIERDKRQDDPLSEE